MNDKTILKLNIGLLIINFTAYIILLYVNFEKCQCQKIYIASDHEISDTMRFSPDNLKKTLIYLKVKHPEIVYQQAVVETGNFTSPIFKENNNLFGMKHPSKRETTSLGKNRGHAIYNSWLDSVVDMVYFQNYYKFRIENLHSDYYDFLDSIYAEDGDYSTKLKKVNYEF